MLIVAEKEFSDNWYSSDHFDFRWNLRKCNE